LEGKKFEVYNQKFGAFDFNLKLSKEEHMNMSKERNNDDESKGD